MNRTSIRVGVLAAAGLAGFYAAVAVELRVTGLPADATGTWTAP